SRMEADGRLVEDWGSIAVRVTGEGIPNIGPFRVEAVKLDNLIPAARAVAERGPVRLTLVAYRAPAWPSGVDVLTVRVEEIQGASTAVKIGLELPPKARIGNRAVTLSGRTIVSCPPPLDGEVPVREWGACDDSVPMPGWGKPAVPCDPAFRNIRAGMGGVPIRYQFTVPKRSKAKVALGFCESHWKTVGERVLLCRVEGAPPQTVDPIAAWGQHKPGALLFDAADDNGDGKLDITVRGAVTTSDRNPILNVIWIFPATAALKPTDVVAGKCNPAAIHYVDVGGPNDQTLFPNNKVEYHVRLPANGARELVFYVACSGGTAPSPTTSAWTPETLYHAALDVWRNWR
ncbi:MAG: hypothetical protein N3B01_06025, partial [Verrucomicrobiae bacterium]|nr:hypothetical protein [Verrucomicrobiae bacterium]